MGALEGILHRVSSAGQTLPQAVAMDSSSDGGDGSSSSDSATISANDFLTLLVTEMQNQDPTADTDPNEYINQLVNVNSLEQLIDINQTLSTATGAGATTPTGGVTQSGASAQSLQAAPVNGNLTIPSASSASHRVAEALSGRHAAQ